MTCQKGNSTFPWYARMMRRKKRNMRVQPGAGGQGPGSLVYKKCAVV